MPLGAFIVKQLFRMVRGMLDPVTSNKFDVLSGSATLDAPCPTQLGDIVLLDQIPLDAQKMHQALASAQ